MNHFTTKTGTIALEFPKVEPVTWENLKGKNLLMSDRKTKKKRAQIFICRSGLVVSSSSPSPICE